MLPACLPPAAAASSSYWRMLATFWLLHGAAFSAACLTCYFLLVLPLPLLLLLVTLDAWCLLDMLLA
jgi:hypothetical protein